MPDALPPLAPLPDLLPPSLTSRLFRARLFVSSSRRCRVVVFPALPSGLVFRPVIKFGNLSLSWLQKLQRDCIWRIFTHKVMEKYRLPGSGGR